VHIGLFGGTFDPPHVCHTLFCVYVLEMTDVEKIIWAPCADHPFGKAAAPFERRLAMSRMAARLLAPHVEVSDIENTLPHPSYTINTVEALRRQWPDGRISVLIGSDNIEDLDHWREIERLRQVADFIVVPRGGYASRCEPLAAVLPELSSTAIRNALREGCSVEGALQPDVIAYIRQHRLYRE